MALEMNGLRFWFQACINASIACLRSGTLNELPRRIAFSVNSLNQRSTKFSQLELVGTKVTHKARMRLQPRLHVRFFVRSVLVHHQMQLQLTGETQHLSGAETSATPDADVGHDIHQ